MYQKIKYIIIATMVLLILVVVITLDANTRYAAMKKEKNTKKQQEIAKIQQEYYKSSQNNAPQTQPSQNSNSYEQYNIQQNQNTTDTIAPNSVNQQYTTEENPVEPVQPSLSILETNNGYFVDENTGERLKNYTLEKSFQLDDEIYAIISSTTEDTETPGYIKKDIIIYQIIDGSYKYAKYIFTKNIRLDEPEENASANIEENGNNLIIQYIGKGTITRAINKESLKNSYKQNLSYPSLKYVEYTTEYNQTSELIQ